MLKFSIYLNRRVFVMVWTRIVHQSLCYSPYHSTSMLILTLSPLRYVVNTSIIGFERVHCNRNVSIATDKRGYPHNMFLISLQKHMLWYSLEAPRQGASIEYPQHMFSWRNKKDISIFRMKKVPYLLLWIVSQNDKTLKQKQNDKQYRSWWDGLLRYTRFV